MNTFTVTFHHSNNYGALLQAYALQQAVTKLGFENTIFEYPYNDKFYDKVSLKNPKTIYSNFSKFIRKDKIKSRQNSFDAFHKKRMKLSRIYNSMDDLRNDLPDADILITGSDQVWRFSGNKEFIPARFLDFGADNLKRFSYAASIEKLNYTDEQKEKVKQYLKKFSGVSLREESAKEYICEITGIDAIRVLDPVFLLSKDEWNSIAKTPRVTEPYILCYQVQSNPRMQELVDFLKKKYNLKVVSVLPSSYNWIKADFSFFDVSPEEFLGLYNNAEIVVSASFHGTAFGLLYGKPTYGLVKSNSASRIKEILSLFSQSDFCIDADSKIPLVEEFDLKNVNEKLLKEKECSLEYLRKQLFI